MIRTRFAPSPTGYLHIGGVRTALFNWLLARRHGGQFILRIDDTDAERNRPEALQPILDGFRWLGIDWDEGPGKPGPYGPYFQSERGDLYRDAAWKLLESGHAYPDYLTKEELTADRVEQALRLLRATKPNPSDKEIEAERKAALAGNRPYYHRGPHRNTPAAECARLIKERPTALRFKAPLGRTVAIDDLIRGHVEWQTDELGDPVILRPDGRPLYNFATVVDDVAMKITHVVRAAEHLSNTPTQVLIYEAMGAALPQFAHVPLVFLNGKKMSKRDADRLRTQEAMAKLRAIGFTAEEIACRLDLNPIAVAFYRELGYLPAAVVNYLGRLGWSLDDKTEVIPLDQMRDNFGLDRVNNAPGNFDADKLYWLAGEYMRKLSLEERAARVVPFLQRAGLIGPTVDDDLRKKILRVVEACGDRLKLFSDILLYGATFFQAEPTYDPKAVDKWLRPAGTVDLLRAFRAVLETAEPYTAAGLEERLSRFCEERGVKAKAIVQPLRVSIVGTGVGVGMFDCLEILGRRETLRRIDLGLAQVSR
jgi:glutamyl-tRNA synthetase